MTESYAAEPKMITMAKSKKSPKALEHMRVMPAENGGVSVEHHFTHYEHSPETHVFGKGDHKAFAAHMMKHSGMDAGGKDDDIEEAEDGGSEESEGNEQA